MKDYYNKFLNIQHGQAMITLVFFVLIAMTISASAVMVMISNSIATSKFEQGNLTYYIAEAGVENAILRLLRNPSYCGEVLPVGTGNATITVVDGSGGCTGVSPFTITVVGAEGNFSRTIQLQATYGTGGLVITSWEEI